jgi:hypothetical protein
VAALVEVTRFRPIPFSGDRVRREQAETGDQPKGQATNSKLVKVKPNLPATLAYCTEIWPKRVACVLLVAVPLAFAFGQTGNTTSHWQRRTEGLYSELDALIVKHQYGRADQVVRELLAISDDPRLPISKSARPTSTMKVGNFPQDF